MFEFNTTVVCENHSSLTLLLFHMGDELSTRYFLIIVSIGFLKLRLKIVLKEDYLWYLPRTYRERPWDWENSWWPSWPRIRNEKELRSCQRQVHQTRHPILQQRCPLTVSYAGWIQHGWFCDRYRCQFSEKSYLGWIPGILRF